MRVVFTIDVECYSGDYEAEVHAGGLGLPFILARCAQHDVRATWFVETLGATRWGMAGVRKVCRDIEQYGQEIQLHIHPSLAMLDGFQDQDDVLWNQNVATQKRLIECGLDVLSKCGVKASAFRAGDLAANDDTLRAMKMAGLAISSNRDLDTKSSIRSRINASFPIVNDVAIGEGLIDVPVTAFLSPLPRLDGRFRHFEVCALSFREMKDGLLKACKAGYSSVCILTHPGEYFRTTREGAVPIPKNCRRLDRLLGFIKSRPEFRMCTISDCAVMDSLPTSSPPEIELALSHTLLRVAAQGMDRIRARLGR